MKTLQKKHWDALCKMAEKKWRWAVPAKYVYLISTVDYIYCFLEFNSNGDIELEHRLKDNIPNRTRFRQTGLYSQELTDIQRMLLKVGYDAFIKYKDNYI